MTSILKFMRTHKLLTVVVALGAMMVASADSCGGGSSSQNASQAQTESYTKAATSQVPYPQAQMDQGGWLERRLLKENLLRQNDKNRIAYVTLLNMEGQPITQFTIQGMVFDLNSQMTTEDIVNDGSGDGGGGNTVTRAAGDNGTWGPEPPAIGFFTTEGVEVKWNGTYIETDSPLDLTTKPLITYNAATAQAPKDASGVKSTADGGINTGK